MEEGEQLEESELVVFLELEVDVLELGLDGCEELEDVVDVVVEVLIESFVLLDELLQRVSILNLRHVNESRLTSKFSSMITPLMMSTNSIRSTSSTPFSSRLPWQDGSFIFRIRLFRYSISLKSSNLLSSVNISSCLQHVSLILLTIPTSSRWKRHRITCFLFI